MRKAGSRVRITAQLIDAADDSHVWADRYDGALDDIFALQDQVTGEIVAALELKLRAPDPVAAARRHEPSAAAYDHVLRARQFYFRFTPEANAAARAEVEMALAIDPEYADAVALMSECHLQAFHQVWGDDPKSELRTAADHACRAIELDPQLPQGHTALASVRLWQRRNDEALEEIDRAIALSPSDSRFLGLRAMVLTWSGSPHDAIADAMEAIRMDPNSGAVLLWTLGMAQYHVGRHDDAETSLRQAALLNPDFMPVHLWLAANEVRLGKAEDATDAIVALHRVSPAMTIRRVGELLPLSDVAMFASMAEDLRKAGLPE